MAPKKKLEGHERAKRVSVDCSASRPKHNPLCRVAVDGLAEGQSGKGEVVGLGASVGNGVENGKEQGASNKSATKHE